MSGWVDVMREIRGQPGDEDSSSKATMAVGPTATVRYSNLSACRVQPIMHSGQWPPVLQQLRSFRGAARWCKLSLLRYMTGLTVRPQLLLHWQIKPTRLRRGGREHRLRTWPSRGGEDGPAGTDTPPAQGTPAPPAPRESSSPGPDKLELSIFVALESGALFRTVFTR
jgi:hypothetical protein